MSPSGSKNAPEARAREKIDGLLTQAGWLVQDRDDMNLTAGDAIAVRDTPEDVAAAVEWTSESRLTVDDEISYVHEYELVTLARVLIAQNEVNALDAAVRRLDPSPKLLQICQASLNATPAPQRSTNGYPLPGSLGWTTTSASGSSGPIVW